MTYREPSDIERRYLNDPEFHALVTMIQQFYATGRFTPSELRAAVIYAATLFEMTHQRAIIFDETTEWTPALQEQVEARLRRKKP